MDNVHIFKKRRRCSRFFVEHLWFCVTYMTRGGAKKSTTSVFALSTSSLYIHEHNRGGAWSLSTSSPIFMNTTEEVFEVCHVQKQKVSTSPPNIKAEHLLLWFEFMFTTEVFDFFEWTNLPFWAPPLVMYVTQNQRCLTKNLKHLFWLNTSVVFINLRGGGAQRKILNTSSVFWKCVHCP